MSDWWVKDPRTPHLCFVALVEELDVMGKAKGRETRDYVRELMLGKEVQVEAMPDYEKGK